MYFLEKNALFVFPLVEDAWTFCMYFIVVSNFYYDFMKLSPKVSQ